MMWRLFRSIWLEPESGQVLCSVEVGSRVDSNFVKDGSQLLIKIDFCLTCEWIMF